MNKRSFDDETLLWLREMPIAEVLTRLDLHWKEDPDFQPEKDKRSKRLHVAVKGRIFELVVTGLKWYDMRTGDGGGGGIDLTMHLLQRNFVSAVKELTDGKPGRSTKAS